MRGRRTRGWPQPASCNHGAHSRMGDDHVGLGHCFGEFGLREPANEPHGLGFIGSVSNLGEDVVTADRGGPFIHDANKAVKREHRAHGDEDHRTAPQNSGRRPSPLVSSGHCVSQTSAFRSSQLGRDRQPLRHWLSSRSRSCGRRRSLLASRMAIRASRRPVEITTFGRSRKGCAEAEGDHDKGPFLFPRCVANRVVAPSGHIDLRRRVEADIEMSSPSKAG